MQEIKSLSALLFCNLAELLNGKEKKEEIYKSIPARLQAGIEKILEEIVEKISVSENESNSMDLTGYYKILKKVNVTGDLFNNIEHLEKIEKIVSNMDYCLPAINKEELIQLKKDFVKNDSTRGVSRAQIIVAYCNYKKEQKVFTKKKVEILVKYVFIPAMIENNQYKKIMDFFSNYDNFFYKKDKGIEYGYKKKDIVEKSIAKLISDYKEANQGIDRLDIPSFQEFLKALFLQLDDSSVEEDDAFVQTDAGSIRDEIDKFVLKKLGNIIKIETTGMMKAEQDNMRMCIAQRIEKDYQFFNNRFSFNWKECYAHEGFKALAYYRIYKILCSYEDNEFFYMLGRELLDQCWKETSVYISPESDVVAPIYLGKNCIISSACKIEKNVVIGSGTKIISSCIKGVEILNNENDYDSLIILGKNSIIMQNVLIYDEAQIGEQCIIKPKSVVKGIMEKNGIYDSNGKQEEITREDYLLQLRTEEIQCVRI